MNHKESAIDSQPIFKGLLRTATLFGVPLQPLILISSILIWLSIAVHIAIIFLLPISILIIKESIRYDENIFKLMYFKIKFRGNKKSSEFYGANTYNTKPYRKKNKYSNMPNLSILGLEKNPNIEKLLPYSTLLTKDIVKTHDYDFIVTWEVGGTSFEVDDIEDINNRIETLNSIFKQTGTKKFSFYVHTTRRRIEDDLPFEYSDIYLEEFSKAYYKTLSSSNLYENIMYLTLIYSPLNTKINRSSFKKLTSKVKRKEIKHYTDEVDEMTDRIELLLKDFRILKLSVYQKEGIKYSSQLEFYSFLLSGKFKRIRVLNSPLSEYLTGGLQNIQFGKDTVQFNFPNGNKNFARIIEFKEYGIETYAGILNILMYLDIDYTITQSFSPKQKIDAKNALTKQQNQLEGSEDDAVTQITEISIALDQLISGEISFGEYHFCITIFANTKKKLIYDTNEALASLTDTGFTPILADIALPATFFAQLPANTSYRPRVDMLSSLNFSSLTSFHGFPKGKRNLNCWGDAITILKTPNKQPYYLNFHENQKEDDFGDFHLGNVFIIGKSGGGKTAFLNFILNMMMKYNNTKTFPNELDKSKKKATFVYFDKDYGAMGNILAIGGKYLIIRNGESTGFNPFKTKSTKTNINHIQVLIKLLVTRNGELLTVKEEEHVNTAIEFIMKEFEIEDRSYPISLLIEQLTENNLDNNSLKKRLKLWSKGNKFGWVFDNDEDKLNALLLLLHSLYVQ